MLGFELVLSEFKVYIFNIKLYFKLIKGRGGRLLVYWFFFRLLFGLFVFFFGELILVWVKINEVLVRGRRILFIKVKIVRRGLG